MNELLILVENFQGQTSRGRTIFEPGSEVDLVLQIYEKELSEFRTKLRDMPAESTFSVSHWAFLQQLAKQFISLAEHLQSLGLGRGVDLSPARELDSAIQQRETQRLIESMRPFLRSSDGEEE